VYGNDGGDPIVEELAEGESMEGVGKFSVS
jgi:hypothetical protein